MSFNDIYTANPGSPVGGQAPGLPPINLPASPRRPPLRVEIKKEPEPEVSPWASKQKLIEDTGENEQDIAPWAEHQPAHTAELEQQIKQAHAIGTGEALGRGFADTATYGLSPAIQGALQAGQRADESEGAFSELRNVIRGLYNLVEGEPETVKAYQQARDEERQKNEEAFQQHPIAYGTGAVAGGLASPTPIKLGPANFLGRVARGAVAGGVSGGLYGAGTAVSKGESFNEALPEIAGSAATGATLGATLHGLIGPRVRPTVSPGQSAAQTAEKLGAPIPKGLASDNTAINSATAGMRSFPVLGSRVSNAVDATQRAAGRRVAEIAAGSSGIPPNRALAGGTLRPALRAYQQENKDTIGRAYNLLKQVSDTTKFARRIATGKAVEDVLRQRRGARLANPQAGLEDVLNILYGGKGGTFGGGISFKGLQEARSLLGEKLAFPEQHPGFRVGEGRHIYEAMTRDMEDAIRKYAKINPDEAVRYLKMAHQVAKEMIERNGAAQHILNIGNDESLAGALINTASKTRGNLSMLQHLKSVMPAQDFEHIGGALLAELGENTSTGEFSLAKLVTGWGKISDATKQELFSPQHLQDLEEIYGLGKHIKGALRESNTSHTSNVLIMFDLARDAILAAPMIAAGTLSTGSLALGGVAATPGIMLAHWLASPAKAASMAKWIKAYRGITLNSPTPARRAIFNIATRNLANTLGVRAEAILHRAVGAEFGQETESRAVPAVSTSSKEQSRALAQPSAR